MSRNLEPIYKRMSMALRRALVAGDALRDQLKHGYFGTEHLLFGLTTVSSGRVGGLDITTSESIRSSIEDIIGPSNIDPEEVSMTPRVKKALGRAERLIETGTRIEPETIIAVLAQDSDSMAAQILDRLGVNRRSLSESLERQVEEP